LTHYDTGWFKADVDPVRAEIFCRVIFGIDKDCVDTPPIRFATDAGRLSKSTMPSARLNIAVVGKRLRTEHVRTDYNV
jgi:hypothetical protein